KANVEKRLVSLIVILLSGILFIGGMVAEGIGSWFHNHAGSELPQETATFLNILIKQTISIIVVSIWFALLFKVLPDAHASWKVVFVGGLFTGILFTAGKII